MEYQKDKDIKKCRRVSRELKGSDPFDLDVWHRGIFLNNLLLKAGLAVRYK